MTLGFPQCTMCMWARIAVGVRGHEMKVVMFGKGSFIKRVYHLMFIETGTLRDYTLKRHLDVKAGGLGDYV